MERAGHGRPNVTKEIVTKMNSANPLETARDLYFSGKFSEAVEIWSEMSEKGDIEAKAWLGSCYANGDGVGSMTLLLWVILRKLRQVAML